MEGGITPKYHSDEALEDGKKDSFHHNHYVDVLKGIIAGSDTHMNIGLYGKWGVGKSSVLKMLKHEIERNSKNKTQCVEVDAWKISGRSIQHGILEEINDQLKDPIDSEELEDDLYNIREINENIIVKTFMKQPRIVMVTILSIMGILVAAGIAYQNYVFSIMAGMFGFLTMTYIIPFLTKMLFASTKKIIPSAVSTVQFNEVYKRMIKNQDDCDRIILIIDNLDRCQDKVAVELLGIIQTFMDDDKCINVIACDDEAVVTHLKNVNQNYTDREGNEFLSKFFQVTVRIPPLIGKNLRAYAKEMREGRGVKFDPYVDDILVAGAIENPRKIKQFINMAVAMYHIAYMREQNESMRPPGVITKHTPFLMKMIIIRHEWPEFYRELENNTDLFNDDKKLRVWLRLDIDEGEKWPKVIEKRPKVIEKMTDREISNLDRFLYATKPFHVDDITPFLRLDQESYRGESWTDELENALTIVDRDRLRDMFVKIKDMKRSIAMDKINMIVERHKYPYGDEIINRLINYSRSMLFILSITSESSDMHKRMYMFLSMCLEKTLNHWTRFGMDETDVIMVLEKMDREMAMPSYQRWIEGIFNSININTQLLQKFLDSRGAINEHAMKILDGELKKYLETRPVVVEQVSGWINDNWADNNMARPSETISYIASKIEFGGSTPETNVMTQIYENIKNKIKPEEKIEIDKRIRDILTRHDESHSPIPQDLLEFLKTYVVNRPDDDSRYIHDMLALLCHILKTNEDVNQSNNILEILKILLERMQEHILTENDKVVVDEGFIAYTNRADKNMLTKLLEIMKTLQVLHSSPSIIRVTMQRYYNVRHRIPDLEKFFFGIEPQPARSGVGEELTLMIQEADQAGFEWLSQMMPNNEDEVGADITDGIRDVCMKKASDKTSSFSDTIYQLVLRLNPAPEQIEEISKYASKLIEESDAVVRERGLVLAEGVNSKFENETAGVASTIKVGKNLLDEGDQDAAMRCIKFAGDVQSRLKPLQKEELGLLYKVGLEPRMSQNTVNVVMQYIIKDGDIVIMLFDTLMEFGRNTTSEGARQICMQGISMHKEHLSNKQKQIVTEVFGTNVLQ